MSPYSDPHKQREFKRKHFREKYRRNYDFRRVEAMRKKPWYAENKEAMVTKRQTPQGSQAMKPLAEVFNAPNSMLPQFCTLRTWMRMCARGTVPAQKRTGKWYTSVGAIDWYIWSCGNELYKERNKAPRKPVWWTTKSSS